MLKGKRLGIIGLILITIFLTADQAALIPNYLLIEDEFGITHTQMGIVSSAFIIIGALAILLWGYLVDKYSRKKLLLIGTLLGEIPCFLTGFVNSYFQLFIVRILTGFGIGVILPVASSLLGDYFPPNERGKGFGWFLFATGLGYLIGAGISGMIGPRFSWRYPFILAAVPNFLLAPLFYLLVKEPERGKTELRRPLRESTVYSYKVRLSDFKKFITIKTNFFLNLQSVSGCIPWGVLSSWIITFFVQERGLSIPMATTFGLGFAGMRMFGSVCGGYLGDYLSKKRAVYRVTLCMLAILLAIPFIVSGLFYHISPDPSLLQILFLFLLAFLGVSLASIVGPNSRAMFLDVNVPENRGIMLSIANLTDVMGGGIGPLIGGLLADKYSLSLALNVSVLFWIPCVLLWIPLLKTLPIDMDNLSQVMARRASETLKRERDTK